MKPRVQIKTIWDRSCISVQLTPKIATRMCLFTSLTLLVTSLYLGIWPSYASEPFITADELQRQLENIRGDDSRLVRWDASSHTAQEQRSGGCNALPNALRVLIHGPNDDVSIKRLACEYATFCVTDNPKNRASLSQDSGIYKAVVRLTGSKDEKASAAACHLIYIASFANRENQIQFVQAGATDALAHVIKDTNAKPIQTMWAASALQNLMASYCNTPGNGRCYWTWNVTEDNIQLDEDSLPVLSDGAPIRKLAAKDIDLMRRLMDLSCQGPVKGEMSSSNPFPGYNALAGVNDDSHNIIAWAATGALKNLALEPSVKPILEGEISCFCRMSHSDDWLEKNKGQGILHHMRPTDPCWFEKNDFGDIELCVDDRFLDEEHYQCDSYGRATETECKAADIKSGTLAKKACCGCGGGKRATSVDATKREL